jgi:glycosyltransferase involved in cell wall biosynthesis
MSSDLTAAGQAPELRVALFTGNYNYIKDGVALTLNRLVAHLERRGIPVLVFAPVAQAPAFDSVGELVPVPSIPIPTRSEYRIALGLPPSARERLKAFRPTLFHIAVPDILGYRALRLAEKWQVPVVSSFHTRYDTYLKFYGLSALERIGQNYFRSFYARCRVVYPPSQSMAETLRAEGLARNIEVWARGIDASVFSPAKRSIKWRQTQGIADDELIISFVGRLVKEKNTGLLADIYGELLRRGLKFRAMLVGNGPEEQRLRAALPEAVFAGFLHGEDLARAYASSDIFLFPSESETFGNVTLEAMASGLPAVCANATGSRSLVVEGETGYCVEASKGAAAFADKLAALLTDPLLRQRMAAAGRARAQLFNWDAIMDGLIASYRRVLSHG